MDYFDLFQLLRRTVTYDDPVIEPDRHVRVVNHTFRSAHRWILSGAVDYRCPVHGVSLREPDPPSAGTGLIAEVLDVHDHDIEENREFRYHVFVPASAERVRDVILLFHGFNEKHWVLDFPYPHRHEDPFPMVEADRGEVDAAARRMLERAAEFLE